MPDKLFNRDVDINIGGIRIATRLLDQTKHRAGDDLARRSKLLKVTFKISKTIKAEPNKAEITIHNLRKESRVLIQRKNVPCVIQAGYNSGEDSTVSTIFSGNLEFGENNQDGTDWITRLQAGDGASQFKAARINTHLKGKVDLSDALTTAMDALGINPGNLQKAIASGNIRSALQQFQNGVTFTGKSEQAVRKIAKKMGLDFSIQDGAALFLGPTDVVDTRVIELAPGTGLIGSPEQGEKGFVSARSLLQPELLPGKRVKFTTREVEGFYRIERSDFLGDTWGNDWFTDIECKPL